MAAMNRVSSGADQEERTPGRWVDLAQVLLDKAGWRSATRKDEIDFQARARWERLLDEVALLDFDGRRMAYREFVEILETQAGEMIFAPESHGAPVQVMGALEASGQQFDAVWFLGMDDQAWPARGRMHPLLPNDVQRRRKMPHATTQDDWELARVATERIAAQGSGLRAQGSGLSSVVFSHAERDKDGELRPSPLIAHIASHAHSKPTQGFEWGTEAPGHWKRSRELLNEMGVKEGTHTPEKLQEINDTSGTIEWPREQCAGGASVLKDQAACPFRAFAARRLNAGELNRSDWGLSGGERGTLLHRVMERLWSPEEEWLHTLEDLQAAITENRLREVIEEVIAEVFAPQMKEHGGDAWMEAYLKSEQRRLHGLLDKWLREYEAPRVPFTVEATEKMLDDVSVGGLKLRLRADRVDNVAENQRLLLDYKSGADVSTAGWEGSRPDEPQLPLYAIFGNVEAVCGVLLARIRAGETELEGCVSDVRAQIFANKKPSSNLAKNPYNDAMRDEWRAALLNLAEDFLQGEAQVDPKDGKKTCTYCAFPGLCRVAELKEAIGADETEPGESDE
jgi:ATP-dependent helicase/nuclease subunit B